MTDIFNQAIGDISGGRVLDVATGEGGFVGILKDTLKDFTEIIGIDIQEPTSDFGKDIFAQENIQFSTMDAEKLEFGDDNFDSVAVSASLHHLENIPKVLVEMKRVLKPGGYFIIAEMHSSGKTEPQLSVVYLHHWAAEVDTAVGILHNKTLSRQDIQGFVDDLDLHDVVFYDSYDTDPNPMDPERLKSLRETINTRTQRAEEAPDYEAVKGRGEELLQRLIKVGATREPVTIVTGIK